MIPHCHNTRHASPPSFVVNHSWRVLAIASVVLLHARWAVADTPSEQGKLNAMIVAQDITRLGERTVIRSLKKDKKQWTNFISSISSAEQAWIDLGLLLLPHTTGAARAEVRIAFEDALVAAPATTIGSISPRSPNLGVICGPSAHPEYHLAENSIDQRLRAVGSVLVQENPSLTDASLKGRLNMCADMLQAADERIRRDQSKGVTQKKH